MKLFRKKKNNKGFSLVELIVVVAIMAVLMAILIPTLIRYVEKTKFQKDMSAIEEIRSQMDNTLVSSEKFTKLTGTIGGVTYSNGKISLAKGELTDAAATFIQEVAQNLGGEGSMTYDYDLGSKLGSEATAITFTIGADSKVTANITTSGATYKADDSTDRIKLTVSGS